jgi:hypothetical protein
MSGETINCPNQGDNNKKFKINPKPIPQKRMLKVAPKNIHLTQKPAMNVLSHKTVDQDIKNEEPVKPKPKLKQMKKEIENDVLAKKDGDIFVKGETKPKIIRTKQKSRDNNTESDDGDDDDDNDDVDMSNVPLITEMTLTKKETYHYKIIDKYYKTLDIKKVLTFIDIVEKRGKVSLRLIDWFVTKYSYKYKVRLDNNENDQDVGAGFNIYISYKAQLQSYKKRYFDPFRRKKRLKFKYFFDKEKKVSLCTTIAQLNFFKWAFTNNIVDYVLEHAEIISKAMTKSNKLNNAKKNGVTSITEESSIEMSGVSNVTDDVSNDTSLGRRNGVKKGPVKKVKKVGISKQIQHDSMSVKF